MFLNVINCTARFVLKNTSPYLVFIHYLCPKPTQHKLILQSIDYIYSYFINFFFEGSTVSSTVMHQLSVRAEHLANLKFLRTPVRSNIPKQPLPTPSNILLLGRSVANPKPQYNGTVMPFSFYTFMYVLPLQEYCKMPTVQ